MLVCIVVANLFTNLPNYTQDYECYNRQECQMWSAWAEMSILGNLPSPYEHCHWSAKIRIRKCLTNPNINQIYFISGGTSHTQGSQCPMFQNDGSYESLKRILILIYGEVVEHFSNLNANNDPNWRTNYDCNGGNREIYEYWYPGSCTHICTYSNINIENDLKFYEYSCTDGWCCGMMYYCCWDPISNKVQIVDVATNDRPGDVCPAPTGDPQWGYCGLPEAGYILIGVTDCKEACEDYFQ